MKNCSRVLSLGLTSPNLTSNLANTCSTETLEPIARSTSAALPRSERLTLFIIRASWYNPLCYTLSSSLLHCAYEDSPFWPSPENITNRGGTSVVYWTWGGIWDLLVASEWFWVGTDPWLVFADGDISNRGLLRFWAEPGISNALKNSWSDSFMLAISMTREVSLDP